ncbi:chemotaxis protein CheB [Algoriphagus sp. NG3]|uniref:chemotaxis protein CheB n=1 Tax=Algoriphagus sp. NG3 TaxID=3097546 RepID=UPI002A828FD8|nr:chemotaxis protein CheB [Algoriphagus sp. NG3]WPR75198.1 chemotaxis protein CheB [Algoriphagus sp. NG3]
MINKEELYIIGIGASAGGMEALHMLFDHTPEDGVAYVIIQHISADHKSFMAELLEQHSKLKISIAKHGTLVEPNRVYLMPENWIKSQLGGISAKFKKKESEK